MWYIIQYGNKEIQYTVVQLSKRERDAIIKSESILRQNAAPENNYLMRIYDKDLAFETKKGALAYISANLHVDAIDTDIETITDIMCKLTEMLGTVNLEKRAKLPKTNNRQCGTS